MKKNRLYILITLIFNYSALFSQEKKTVNADMVWLGYYNSVKINTKFSINSDFQARTRNSQWYQFLGRTGVVYALSDRVFLLAGFSTFLYPQNNDVTILRKEWRPWEEIMFTDNIGRLKIIHRFRLEERYNQQVVKDKLTDSYSFNYRFRYKLDLQYPLFRKDKTSHVFFANIGNELMINAGKIIKYNYFDQNRTWIGLNFVLNQQFTFQLQYMHIWQQQSNGYTLEDDNVLRFNIYHTINGKRKNTK
jgi:hypothetical protein